MLMCSNASITEGFPIFDSTFNAAFGVSLRFETPIKICKVMDSFVLLAGFEFSMGMYG